MIALFYIHPAVTFPDILKTSSLGPALGAILAKQLVEGCNSQFSSVAQSCPTLSTPALPRVPAPSPSRIYTPSRCPPHSDSQKTAGEPAPRPLERSFWVSPQPDPSPPSASSHRPPQHPAGHLCPSKPLTSPTRICTCLPTAHSRKPLRGFHDRVGGGTRENRPTPAAPDGAPGRGEGAASPPRPTSSIHPLGSYSTPTGRMSTAGSQTLAPLQGAKSRLARTHREIDRCLRRGGEGGGGGDGGKGASEN